MSRMGIGAVLFGAAITLASLIGCVSPPEPEPAAEEAEADEMQAMVAALESEVAALASQVQAAENEAAAAQAAASAAQDRAAAAAAAQAEAAAEAAAEVAAARQTAAQARAAAAQAQAEAGALRAAAPARGIAVSPEHLDLSLLDLSAAQVAVAGPDSLYVSSIKYAGRPYSALLRYQGGTTATVERVYGPGDAAIPAAIDLSRTQLSLVAPDTLQVANVDVDGRGFSGQLRHTGGNELEVAGIQRVTLPPAAAQQVARLQERLAAAQAAGAGARSAAAAAEADAGAAQTELAAAKAAADTALSEAQAAAAAAAAAQAEADSLRAAAHQPAAIAVAADRLVPGRLSFASAQASVAGPDTIYVSGIEYQGRSYSALLKYRGGTSATVEQVYGPRGKLIPDSVSLAQAQLAFAPPDALNISYVELNGRGYSGQLRYAGGNRLRVDGIRRVALPPTAAQQVAAARAATATAQAAAEAAAAEAAQARAELAVIMQDAAGRRIRPALVDFNLLDLDLARVSVAGPESIYVSGIRYAGGVLAARLRYTGESRGMVEELFDTTAGRLPELDLSAPAFEVRGPETMVISNVGIGGAAYSFTLQFERGGEIVISQRGQGHRVRSAAELLRDELLSGPGVTRVVNGVRGGRALPEEGAWVTSAAVVSQTDAASSHAKFAFHDVAQPAAPTLYGVTVRAAGDRKVGYGLHVLASGTPLSGNTWNYGRSYLVWATRERDFYDTEATQVQLYESLDGNRLMWLNSRNLLQGLTPGLTLEALYQPEDCAEPPGGAPCYGSITVLVDGAEQFKVAVSAEVARREADAIALRALGGPVEFTDLYVHSRR